MNEGIPPKFVWNRMNVDAGESLENIVRRKELERQSGEGEFWWGVGESKGPAVVIHLADCEPEVLFSRGLSTAITRDTDPDGRFFYTTYRVYDRRRRNYGGKSMSVPENIIVQSGPRDKYFALVCRSQHPLDLSEGDPLDAAAMRNIKNDGKEGKSPERSPQTTCVVKYPRDAGTTGAYRVNLRADLVQPRFVKLGGRKQLSDSQCRLLDEVGNEGKTVDDYRDVVRKIRG